MRTLRLIILAAAIALGSTTAIGGAPAMAIKGQCDPGPAGFNTQMLGDAEVIITVRYGWDGVSVFPACNGPILDVRAQNIGARVRQVRIPLGRQSKTLNVQPGTDVTFTGAQLATIGLVTLADLAEMQILP